jgi:ABC-type branched-subunit amino acid transport system substrate-binding protein
MGNDAAIVHPEQEGIVLSTSRHFRLIALISLLVLSFALVACGGDDDEAENGTAQEEPAGEAPEASFDLQIGDLVPLTGDLSPFGPPGRKAADLAVEEIEAAIEEVGAEINVSVEHADTETNEQAAVQAARQLVNGGAGCLTGAWASSNTIPVGNTVAARQQVPLISPASTNAAITDLDDDGFVFRTAPSDNLQGVALADTIEEELGGTDFTVSLAARNDAYGEGFINVFQEAWEERGGQVTGPVLYDPQQPNYNTEAGQIVADDPDAYVIIDFPETFARMGPALVRTGTFDSTQLFTADGLASDSIPEGVPEGAMAGARGTRPATPEDTELASQFNQLFTDAPGPGRQTFDAQNFDATILCFLGAVAAGSGEGPEIQQQLTAVSGPGGEQYDYTQLADAIRALQEGQEIDYVGVTGPVDFDENGDPTTATYEVWQYGEDDGELSVMRQFEAEGEEDAAGGETE